MSHLKGIAFELPEVQLQKLREQLRLMSDEEMLKFGEQVRSLTEPRVSVIPDPWKEQLQGGACRVATPASKGVVKTCGSGGTSVRSPFAHEGATAVYTGGDAGHLTTRVRRVSIRELPYLRRGEPLVASGQSEPEEGGFPGRAYVSEGRPAP